MIGETAKSNSAASSMASCPSAKPKESDAWQSKIQPSVRESMNSRISRDFSERCRDLRRLLASMMS